MIHGTVERPEHVSDYEQAKFESYPMIERQCQYARAICSKRTVTVKELKKALKWKFENVELSPSQLLRIINFFEGRRNNG